MKRIVLAYSGDLKGTAAIPWLVTAHDAEVVTVTLDLGQARELAHVRERALAAGALRAHVMDAREEFLREYVLPLLQSSGYSPDDEFPGVRLSREIVAKRLVELARMESAGAVAHIFDSADADGRRHFDSCVRQQVPSIAIVAIDGDSLPRGEIAPGTTTEQNSRANVWGRVVTGEAGSAEYKLTRGVSDAPDESAFLELDFESGVPVRANGVDLTLIEMIESIETIAGTHAVGRLPAPNGVAESPAAVVLHTAYRELSNARPSKGESLDGTVRLRLFKGTCEVAPIPEPVT